MLDIIEKLKIEKQKWVNKIYGVGETRIDLMIDDVIEELETYKKIAEKLAEISRCVNVSDDECHKKTCEQCVIDWARKEVEKDET